MYLDLPSTLYRDLLPLLIRHHEPLLGVQGGFWYISRYFCFPFGGSFVGMGGARQVHRRAGSCESMANGTWPAERFLAITRAIV